MTHCSERSPLRASLVRGACVRNAGEPQSFDHGVGFERVVDGSYEHAMHDALADAGLAHARIANAAAA
jgi:hypothetical protein